MRQRNFLSRIASVAFLIGAVQGFVPPRIAQNRQSTSSVRPEAVTVVSFWKQDSESPAEIEENVEFFIRPSVMADTGRASKILADGFFKGKTNFIQYQLERLETYLSLESTFPQPNTLHQLFVACDSNSGKVLGIAEVDARKNQASEAFWNQNKSNNTSFPREAYLCNLAVDLDYQRQGLGVALVKHCEEQVQAWVQQSREYEHLDTLSNSLFLRVRSSNKAAIRMYDKLGYQSVQQEADPKFKGDILVMRKQFQDISTELQTLEDHEATS